ncbi:hypothetical protein ABVT39_000163 [Epinephelus coioides]
MFDGRIVAFMLLLGINVNKGGAYEVALTVFFAQLSGITQNWGELFTLGDTAIVFNISEEGSHWASRRAAPFLLVVKLLLDRCNTTVTVLGDGIGMALKRMCKTSHWRTL